MVKKFEKKNRNFSSHNNMNDDYIIFTFYTNALFHSYPFDIMDSVISYIINIYRLIKNTR